MRAALLAFLIMAACSGDPLRAGAEGGAPDASMDARPVDGGLPSMSEAGSEIGSEAGGARYTRLSETGLYEDPDALLVAADAREYAPRFALWSDGLVKRRFLRLPAGARIDAADPDHFRFPVGTKVWKEFSRGDLRIETRLFEKVTESEWFFGAFQWNAAQTDARFVPDGVTNAAGTDHDIPSREQCSECHGRVPDSLLSVGAVQLDHEGPGLTLATLVAEGSLGDEVPDAAIPGDAAAQAALGYLHANCGGCHNPTSDLNAVIDLDLSLHVPSPARIEETATYRTTVNALAATVVGAGLYRIVPGEPERSAVYLRMSERGSDVQMPPLATKHRDEAGLSTIATFIRGVAENLDAGSDASR